MLSRVVEFGVYSEDHGHIEPLSRRSHNDPLSPTREVLACAITIGEETSRFENYVGTQVAPW